MTMQTPQNNITRNTITTQLSLAVALVVCLVATSVAQANNGKGQRNNRDNQTLQAGLLDQPLIEPGRQISRQEARRLQREQRRLARIERQRLRRMNRQQRQAAARSGDRLAQLVLAEEFAEEALQWSAVPAVANDALSDAARWYSLAAKRGYPGAPAVDKVLPAMPMRVIRSR